MNVIGHDHVSADGNVMITGSGAIFREGSMNILACKKRAPGVRIEGHEEKRCIDRLVDPLQAWRFPFAYLVQARRCSVRCPQRTSLA